MSGLVTVELLNSITSGINGFTADGGMYVTLTNRTGANTVKGQVVQADTANGDSFVLSIANSVNPIGIVFESGIANGSSCKVVVSGKAYALLKNGVAGVNGSWCGCSDNAGRMYQQSSPPATSEHDREIGHSLQTITSGTNVLCLIIVHFR